MFDCPVCNWPEIKEDPGLHTYEICPCCGCEFGNDDEIRTHAELRSQWVGGGMKWWSKYNQPSEGWDPVEQLNR
jgi:hypothetical protein